MIRMEELNPHKGVELTEEQGANLLELHGRLNKVRDAFGRPMIVTSGLRTWDQHVQIYVKSKQLVPAPHSNLPGAIRTSDGQVYSLKRGGRFPTRSQHLIGAAADIADPKGVLWGWIMDHKELVKDKLGLYLEDKSKTPGWVHFQIYPPRSGNWVFLP